MSNKGNEKKYYMQRVPDKNYRIFILCGIGFVVIALIKIIYLLYLNVDIDAEIGLITILVIGIIIILISLINIFHVNKKNANLIYFPYGFNYKLEIDIYRNIGGNNKKLKENEKFEKYTEWKEYITTKFHKQKGNEDFYRYLTRMIRIIKRRRYIEEKILIPTEIAMISISFSGKYTNYSIVVISVLITIIIVGVMLEIPILQDLKEIEFLDDFIEILFTEKNEVDSN